MSMDTEILCFPSLQTGLWDLSHSHLWCPRAASFYITLLVTMVKCVVPFLMNKTLPKHLLMWLPMSKNLLFEFLFLPALSSDASEPCGGKKNSKIVLLRVMMCKTAGSPRRSVHTKHSHTFLAKIVLFLSVFILRNLDWFFLLTSLCSLQLSNVGFALDLTFSVYRSNTQLYQLHHQSLTGALCFPFYSPSFPLLAFC